MQIEQIQSFKFPTYDQIPDVGLFLEQVTKYINSYLEPLHIQMTSSMISNYVKKKMVSNPVKKQYYRDQIAYLFFIAISKSVLSLEDVQLFIHMQQESYTSEVAYTYFCTRFESVLQQVFGVKKEGDRLSSSSQEQAMLEYIVVTAANKIYLDSCFMALQRD